MWYFLPTWLIGLVDFVSGLGGINSFVDLFHSSGNASTGETSISQKQVGARGYRAKFLCAFGLQCRDAITPANLHPAAAFKLQLLW